MLDKPPEVEAVAEEFGRGKFGLMRSAPDNTHTRTASRKPTVRRSRTKHRGVSRSRSTFSTFFARHRATEPEKALWLSHFLALGRKTYIVRRLIAIARRQQAHRASHAVCAKINAYIRRADACPRNPNHRTRPRFASRAVRIARNDAGSRGNLYFGRSAEAAKKRVQRLKRDYYISERPRPRGYDPSILHLAHRGFEALRRTGQLADYPAIGWESMERRAHVSPFTLSHELDVLSTKAALTAALRTASRHRIVEFSTWPRLFSFRTRQQTVDGYGRAVIMKPDALLRVQSELGSEPPRSSSFFLELDRSTETQQNLRARASGYLEFYRSGGFAKRYGQPSEDFRQFPFRVLWIFRNTERRNNAAESFLRHHPPILTMPWLTTFDELVKNPLGDIWVRPLDYQRVVRGTRFDPILRSPATFYRRQSTREQFIEIRIERVALFAPKEKGDPSLDRL